MTRGRFTRVSFRSSWENLLDWLKDTSSHVRDIAPFLYAIGIVIVIIVVVVLLGVGAVHSYKAANQRDDHWRQQEMMTWGKTDGGLKVVKFKYDGHEYLYMSMPFRSCDIPEIKGQVVHNPDCPCVREAQR